MEFSLIKDEGNKQIAAFFYDLSKIAIEAEFLKKSGTISPELAKLTHAELKVANLVMQGISSKEIGASLHISESTTNTHRNNIRKKLCITNQKINLTSYLLSLS